MDLRFQTVDVFTTSRFGGNPLAVFPDARGISGTLMQQLAREFNYSESTFVLPAEDPGNSFRVRIFTPRRELPFAGHPNVGTAHVLAGTGALGPSVDGRIQARFEEDAGIVAVDVRMEAGRPVHSEILAPEPLSHHPGPDAAAVARAVDLSPSDIALTLHGPTIASTGIAFLLVELTSLDALGRARVNAAAFHGLAGEPEPVGMHLYTRDTREDGLDLRARMFAPRDSVPEDPATGSANCALAGLLAELDPTPDGQWNLRIGQGFEMGRPSHLALRTSKRGGTVREIGLGGTCVDVLEGRVSLDDQSPAGA